MMGEVSKAGARFDPARRQAVLGIRLVTGDPNGTTTSLQTLYSPPVASPIHKSLSQFWWIFEILLHRYYEINGDSVTARIPFGAWRKLPNAALLHPELMREMSPGVFAYNPPNLKAGTRMVIGSGPYASYGEFRVATPASDWRQNKLLVFLDETILTAFVLAATRPLLSKTMFPFVMGLLKAVMPEWVTLPGKMLEVAYKQELVPGFPLQYFQAILQLFQKSQHGSTQTGLLWSLAAAPVLVIFWSLVRLVWPRS
jgi:hypothetical protein